MGARLWFGGLVEYRETPKEGTNGFATFTSTCRRVFVKPCWPWHVATRPFRGQKGAPSWLDAVATPTPNTLTGPLGGTKAPILPLRAGRSVPWGRCSEAIIPSERESMTMRIPRSNPCKGHQCDGCLQCRNGQCCGHDKGKDGSGVPAKPSPVTPVLNASLEINP